MANFRFNNEQGQDDTGRVATYVQRLIDLNQSVINLNPLGYVSTYLLGGEQTVEGVTINIAANNKPNIGDYLELIIAPNSAGLTVDFSTGFLNASQIILNAGGRQIANYQYDGNNWVSVLASTTPPTPPIAPYKIYSGLFTNPTSDTMTVVELQNTTGESFYFQYEAGLAGMSINCLNSIFTVDKVGTLASIELGNGITIALARISDTKILIRQRASGTITNGFLFNSFIEIRIYN